MTQLSERAGHAHAVARAGGARTVEADLLFVLARSDNVDASAKNTCGLDPNAGETGGDTTS